LVAIGAQLYQVDLSYRPNYQDILARIELTQMPWFPLTDPALLYGLSLQTHGVTYQVRVAKTGPTSASFGLFRLGSDGTWTHVRDLQGGYGTAGQEVDVAVPLGDIGLPRGGGLSHMTAFTAIGDYLTGADQQLDSISLSR
jgi:hypothetical protein